MRLVSGLNDGNAVGIVQDGLIVGAVGVGESIGDVVNGRGWVVQSDRINEQVTDDDEVIEAEHRDEVVELSLPSDDTKVQVDVDTPVRELF